MMPKDLIQQLCGAECGFAPAEAVDAARVAFLANLTEILRVDLPVGCFRDDSVRGKMLFYAGVITGFSEEIPESSIRDAHLAMMLPANRAIISRLLRGPGQVTHRGVPVDYGV